MKERKSTYTLRLLDLQERARFRKYLNSPYFNHKQEITNYAELLFQAFDEDNLSGLSEVKLWEEVYGAIPYEDVKFRKLNADLTKLIENFLAQEAYEKDNHAQLLYKVRQIRSKKAQKSYPDLVGELHVQRKINPNRNAEFYHQQYQIERAIFDLTPEDERKKDFKGLDTAEISEQLDTYFIAEKLKHYSEILSWNQLYDTKMNIRGIEIVIKLGQNPLFADIPVIAIFRKIINTKLETTNFDSYYELKELIPKFIYLFPDTEAKEIFGAALNFAINQVNKGTIGFEKDTLDLYKIALKDDIIFNDNLLEVSDYRNIVFMALRSGEFDWAENFIEEYKKSVNEKYRDNAYYFSKARLETYKQNYEAVIENVNKISFDDVWYGINARSLLVAAYYELEEWIALEPLLQSFRAFLNREKSLTKERKKFFLDFISFVNQIYLNQADQDKLVKLKDKLNDTVGVVNKVWLTQKIDALLQPKNKRLKA